MHEYIYPFYGGDIVVIALKVEKVFGFLPDAIICTGDDIILGFNSELTSGQKLNLDNTMADLNVGNIPPNIGNTNYLITDIMDSRAVFKAQIGGQDFAIYPVAGGYKIQFPKVLNVPQKNTVTNKWASLLNEA